MGTILEIIKLLPVIEELYQKTEPEIADIIAEVEKLIAAYKADKK